MNWIEIMRPTHRAALYSGSFVDRLGQHDPGWFLDQSWSISRHRDLVTQASIGDLHSYVPCDLMTKVDIASMAHSLEVRQPLLDYRLVEWSAKLPIDLKFRWGKGKLLLREAFYDLIPPSIWNRPKMGFGIPVADWFRGPWRSVLEQNLLNPEMKLRRFLQVDQVRSMVQQHVSGSQVVVAGYALWNLLCLERWLQLHPEVEFDF
jgi:asparagine synthase (glutamine-hydrolysing)